MNLDIFRLIINGIALLTTARFPTLKMEWYHEYSSNRFKIKSGNSRKIEIYSLKIGGWSISYSILYDID